MTPSPSRPTLQTIPARRGAATILRRSQTITIINTHGHQVVDTWAFALSPPSPTSPPHTPTSTLAAQVPEYTSMSHTRASLCKTHPQPGDAIYSQKRAPLLTLTHDTSPGRHDTLMAACDRWRYAELGVRGWHANCTDNCWDALDALAGAAGSGGPGLVEEEPEAVAGHYHDYGLEEDEKEALVRLPKELAGRLPDPLNLFMNIPVSERAEGGGGYVKGLSFEEPVCGRGDWVGLRAERDVVVVMSACPQDVLGICGGKPTEASFQVWDGDVEVL